MPGALFDGHASSYDAWYETELGSAVERVESELVLSAFTPPGPEVLEIGCGTGVHTLRLAERGYRVTAVDASREMLGRARGRLAVRALVAEWVQGDVGDVLPRLGWFHGVLSVAALEFLDDPEAILRDAFEHLEPGGCLVVGFIADGGPWAAFYRERTRRYPGSVFAGARFRSPEEVGGWRFGGREARLEAGLFFPPTAASIAEALRAEHARREPPGFVVAKWVKT